MMRPEEASRVSFNGSKTYFWFWITRESNQEDHFTRPCSVSGPGCRGGGILVTMSCPNYSASREDHRSRCTGSLSALRETSPSAMHTHTHTHSLSRLQLHRYLLTLGGAQM